MKPTPEFDEVHRSVGAICVHATWLEDALEECVTDLSRSDLVAHLVQGERGSQHVRWIQRMLLDDAIDDDQAAAELKALVVRAGKLLDKRDLVVHSRWLKRNQSPPGHITGTRVRYSGISNTEWSLESLQELQQEMETVALDIIDVSWNALAEEMGNPRLPRG